MDRMFQNLFNYDQNKEAIVTSDGKMLTYRQMLCSSISLAKELEIQTRSKNVILYCGDNVIKYAIGLLAIWMADKTAVIIDSNTTYDEVISLTKYFESDLIVTSTEQQKNNGLFQIVPQIYEEGKIIWKKNIYTNEVALIFATSGTTYNPKYVMLGHKGVIEECLALKEAHNFNVCTREYIIVPITSSCATLGQLMPVLFNGGSLVVYEGKINIARVKRTIREYQATIIVLTSSLLALLVAEQKTLNEEYNSLVAIVSAGEASNIQLFDKAKKIFNVNSVTQAYGLTETSSELAGCSNDLDAPYESVGKIINCFQVRIKNGKEVMPCNEIGEIQVKGNAVFLGYYKNEKLTKEAFDEGWFKTGDLGYFDENGYLYFKGRIKNLIVVAGKNVYPEEIEKILEKNSDVTSAFVYGKQNNITGEEIVAEVILSPNSSIGINELLNYCKNNMKSYMIPKKIFIVEKHNVNANGKISRRKNRV